MAILETLSQLGERASDIAERYIPDAWVVCMLLTLVAFALALGGAGADPVTAVTAWSNGMWGLLQITMQFSIAVFAAYACVMSKPGFWLFDRMAKIPNADKPWQAILLMAIVTTVTGFLNWALCFVVSALFIPFLARRNPNTDIRVISAAALMGVGTVTNAGLSGSAALIMATPDNPIIKPAIGEALVDRLYPVTETIFSAFNLGMLVVIAVVSVFAIVLLHPRGNARVVTFSQERLDAILPKPPQLPPRRPGFSGWVENQVFWTWFAGLMILFTLGHNIATQGFGRAWNINAYNAVFLGGALLLHGNPLSFVNAVRKGLDAAYGVILQFPFYGGIFGLMTGTGLGAWLSGLFAEFSSREMFPFIVYVYSAIMNFFVPSAGSKWIIEAPYILGAGQALDVSNITVLLAYMYGDTLTNLIHPYMAIPIMAITGLKFGEFAGYTFFVGVALFIAMTAAMFMIPLTL